MLTLKFIRLLKHINEDTRANNKCAIHKKELSQLNVTISIYNMKKRLHYGTRWINVNGKMF